MENQAVVKELELIEIEIKNARSGRKNSKKLSEKIAYSRLNRELELKRSELRMRIFS